VNLTVSPQIRIVALVGLLAAVGLAGSMFVLGGGGSKTETVATATATQTRPTATATTPAKPHAKPAVPTPAKHAPKPKAKPHATPKPRQPAKFRGNAVYSNLPSSLQWELAHHKVVVVSLYNPRSDVDAISVAEAHAGAVKAGAGFLLVSVLDNEVAGILTALLPGGGLLPDPGVLVYKAPGDVALRLDGFADRDSVAQAATNVIAGELGPAAPATATAAPAPATTPAAPATTAAP
jgi:hypothetical protein